MSTPLALVVDDEPDIRELLTITLGRMEIDTVAAQNVGEARDQLTRHTPDLCLTDMKLPDGSGIDLVRHIQAQYPNIPVAVITAHGNMELAVEALKAGAFDFVSKPVDLLVLRNLVSTALRLASATTESGRRLLGESPAIEQLRSTIQRLARSQAPIYIGGESGTGKELVARLIHEQGPRADRPFVAVNCGAIPAELMESEFFGYMKGSFTGANADKPGLFQAANGGTLFLDEVAELPLSMQVKLLRAIQEKSVRPVGEQREIPVDVRILSATHKDLAALVEDGSFRQDIYYRINVIEVNVPPLRERSGDIPLLAAHILGQLAERSGMPRPDLPADAIAALQGYAFPGNVRELENILERAMTLCDGDRIGVTDLALPEAGAGDEDPLTDTRGDLEGMLARIERQAIQRALDKCAGNKTAAAKELGISFRALRYKLDKLGIN